MTQIIVYSKLFEDIRPGKEFAKGFFHCPMCMGFWVGVFLFGINKNTELFTFEYSILNAFLLGCLSSATSYVLCVVFDDEGVKIRRG